MKNENDINTQIQVTSDLLEQLETEQADFQNRMTLAVGECDSASMMISVQSPAATR